MLLKKAKHERLVEEVTGAVARGDLREGDRLQPFSELSRRYGVSQSVIEKALAQLASAELVVRRRRAGVFVAPGAAERARAADAAPLRARVAASPPGRPLEPDLARRHDVLSQMLGFPARTATRSRIALFVMDGYPEQLALWREALDDFEKAHPRWGVSLDHVDEDYDGSWRRMTRADVVVATPSVLRRLGADTFLPIEDIAAFGVDRAALHPRVAEYVARCAPLPGLPLALVPVLFYLNRDAVRSLGAGPPPRDSVRGWLDALAAAAGLAKPADRQSLFPGDLFSLLARDGALSLRPDVSIAFDAERALRVLEAARRFFDVFGPVSRNFPIDFFAGRLVGIPNGMYLSLYLKTHAKFAWAAQPLPVAANSTGAGMPMLCCGIRRDTAWLPECMSLVSHLCGDRSQRRLAALGHCVPALEAAAFDPAVAAAYPIPAHDMRRVLEQGSACWGERPENEKLIADLSRIGHDAEQAACPAAETLARAEMAYRQYARTLASSAGEKAASVAAADKSAGAGRTKRSAAGFSRTAVV